MEIIGPKSGCSGNTPLHQAASEGHVQIVNMLLKNGALIDSQDKLGNTALHASACKGLSQTIETLCKHKANTNIKNKAGFSPLHMCCQQGHNQSARILLLSGCKPDLKNNYGDTPLHTASRYGHAGVARILISAFCAVSQVNKNGDTALHITAAMGRRKLTKILLEAGCDAAIKNKQGETAMDIALRKSYREVQEILANPPPLRERQVPPKSAKREKESSLGSSRDSGDKALKERRKKSKMGSTRSVHFAGQAKKSHSSPYGCPLYPNMEDFPKPKLNSLPSDPLQKGEQYYIDLAGNIKKGAINKANNCYCAPLLHKVEHKMEMDKRELKEHIGHCHDNLKAKICSLEKKTRHQLVSLNETVKEKLTSEKVECIQRSQRLSLREKLDFDRKQRQQVEQLKGDMRSWLESRLASPDNQKRSYRQNQQSKQSHYANLRFRRTEGQGNAIDPSACYDRPKSCLGMAQVRNHSEDYQRQCTIMRSRSEMYLTGSGDDSEEGADPRPEPKPEPEPGSDQQVTPQTTANGAPAEDIQEHPAILQDVSCQDPALLDTGFNNPLKLWTNGEKHVHLHVHDHEQQPGDTEPTAHIPTGTATFCASAQPGPGQGQGQGLGLGSGQPQQVDSDRSGSNEMIVNVIPEVSPRGSSDEQVTDLMKSLRCNGNTIAKELRESPFTDSGYRTKFSPSPRETAAMGLPSAGHSPIYAPTRVYNNYNHYQPQQNYNHTHHPFPSQVAPDPPIGLPSSHLSKEQMMRRMPINIHQHQLLLHPVSGPSSTLV